MEKLIIAEDADFLLTATKHPEVAANPQAAGAMVGIKDRFRKNYRDFLPARLIASEVEKRAIKISHIGDSNRFICEVYSEFNKLLRSPATLKPLKDSLFDKERFSVAVQKLNIENLKPSDMDIVYQNFHAFFEDICKPAPDDTQAQTTFLSIDPLCNFMYILNAGSLSRDHILAALAISGIATTLPAVYFNHDSPLSDDEILNDIREKYAEEREAYLEFMRLFTQECFERILDGYYADAWQFAKMKTDGEIRQLCKNYEAAISESGKNLKKYLLVGAVHGVPEITKSLLGPSMPQEIGIELLRILCGSLSQRIRETRAEASYPMASYIYKIQGDLSSKLEDSETKEDMANRRRGLAGLLRWTRK